MINILGAIVYIFDKMKYLQWHIDPPPNTEQHSTVA